MNAQATPSPALDQVARLLTLVPFLHVRGAVRLEDAAIALGIDADQLLRDLKVLFVCGLPGGLPDDLIDVDLDALETEDGQVLPDAVIRVSNADYLARPLRLTPTEASAMIVALRALRGGASGETVSIVDRVLAKLEQAAAEGPQETQIDPGIDSGAADEALLATRLQDAVTRRRQVRLSYYVPTRDEESQRVVDPRGVVTANGFGYLDAWCHAAEAPRLFRLDRIGSAEVLDSEIATSPEAPRDLSGGLFTLADDTTTATLHLDPHAAWVTEYYPTEAVRRFEDGSLEVDFVVADPRWLIRLLLRLAPHARLVRPSAYADDFSKAAGDTLALYSTYARTMDDTD